MAPTPPAPSNRGNQGSSNSGRPSGLPVRRSRPRAPQIPPLVQEFLQGFGTLQPATVAPNPAPAAPNPAPAAPNPGPVAHNPGPAPGERTERTKECHVCGDELWTRRMSLLHCEHFHCTPCLQRNARIALASMPFQPARCCTVISTDLLSSTRALVDHELMDYTIKVEEAVSTIDKLYCHSPGCGQYIPQGTRKNRSGVCIACYTKTCKSCHGKTHFGPCNSATVQANREANDGLHQLAQSKGWKSCPNCRNLVQKRGGCDHIA
ncbi:hypothetical protein F4820DRAFT_446711 [Hypoxylon rubiginosum]|uniref:Uncharacterized protein n=1 Tax=Hypoxylon rubiginosum TaxID=110542 RepID=A0ACB9Z5R4_9PEZI|nr:hypothetical protein F4820DRAFT_446711 [Hypoxylon rubiginosum]